jgi:2-polyprenyl-3-methyl-5-hydroxy-6-metoxy-1,4-benzoquinol methylase
VRWLLKLWRSLPKPFQSLIIKAVQKNKRLYRWLLFRYVDSKDRTNGIQADLPPAELRYRVSSSPDAEEFILTGKTCAADVQSALVKVGRDLRSFTRILDFGCGCGRTLVHLRDFAPTAIIDGIDVDAKAIEWCRQHLQFASFKLGQEMPPLEYDADTFDFIYAISVFTHLNQDHQFGWLEELKRIARPGATVLLTVESSLVEDQDFSFQSSYEEGLFPSWYQNTRHSKEYVFTNFGKHFTVLDYFPRAMNAHQDVVVLEKSRDTQAHAFDIK